MQKVIECADWNGATGSFNCKARGMGRKRILGEESGALKFPWVFGSEVIPLMDLCNSPLKLEGGKEIQPRGTHKCPPRGLLAGLSYNFWDGKSTLKDMEELLRRT